MKQALIVILLVVLISQIGYSQKKLTPVVDKVTKLIATCEIGLRNHAEVIGGSPNNDICHYKIVCEAEPLRDLAKRVYSFKFADLDADRIWIDDHKFHGKFVLHIHAKRQDNLIISTSHRSGRQTMKVNRFLIKHSDKGSLSSLQKALVKAVTMCE